MPAKDNTMSRQPDFIVFDLGRWNARAMTKSFRSVMVRNLLKPISMSDYDAYMQRTSNKPSPEFWIVDGQPYVFGEQANFYKAYRNNTASRYSPDIIGLQMVGILMHLDMRDYRDLLAGVLLPPQDNRYRGDLISAIKNERTVNAKKTKQDRIVTSGDKTFIISVARIEDEYEPVAAMMNKVLSDKGEWLGSFTGTTGVFDAGGQTVDFSYLSEDHEINELLTKSSNVSIMKRIEDFGLELRAELEHEPIMRDIEGIPADRVFDAFLSGTLRLAGKQFPVSNIAQRFRRDYLSELNQWVKSLDVLGRVDNLIIAGGVPLVFGDEFFEGFNHGNIMLASKNLDDLPLANVSGMVKLMRMYEKEGVYNG